MFVRVVADGGGRSIYECAINLIVLMRVEWKTVFSAAVCAKVNCFHISRFNYLFIVCGAHFPHYPVHFLLLISQVPNGDYGLSSVEEEDKIVMGELLKRSFINC